MVRRILVWLLGAIIVIVILLWFINGGFNGVTAQEGRFSFSSPWPWLVSSIGGIDNFITQQPVSLPSVAGVSATATAQTNAPTSAENETEQERLDQLQQQYQQLKAQADQPRPTPTY